MSLYSFLAKYLRKAVLKLFKVEVHGIENEPSDTNYLVCSNHLSINDVIIIGAVLKREVRFLAKAELFKIPVLRSVIKELGAYPVNRGTADTGAVKRCISLLKEGEVVGIFPQGTRKAGQNPKGTAIKDGVGMIEYRSHATVLPLCIKTSSFYVRPFKKTVVCIGEPIKFEEFNFTTGNVAEFKSAAKLIFERITDLL